MKNQLLGGAGAGYAFAYNHENQCVTAGWYNSYNKSDYVYDGRGRLRKRTDWSWTGSSWYPNGEVRYLYDGMRVIQERSSANHPAVTYTRGLDLSGTWEGAGGIGGLLARTAHASTTPYQPSSHACYHADGNGNVTYLLRRDRTHGASYKYDPYGKLLASSGPLAAPNTLRFSSKEWHASASIYYYGYRFYVPELQRWLNRDPIGEKGGFNLYAFVANNPANLINRLGHAPMSWPVVPPANFPPSLPPPPQEKCCVKRHCEDAGFDDASACAASYFGELTGLDLSIGAASAVGGVVVDRAVAGAGGPVGAAIATSLAVGAYLQYSIFLSTCEACVQWEE